MGSLEYGVPRVALVGEPYEIGWQHGQQLAPQIVDQLRIYRELFQEACKFDWDTVRSVAGEFRESIGRLAPHLLEEMQGIADGVQAQTDPSVDILDIVALNARSEIALGQWDDGCTSLAWRIRAPECHKQILAQNWDWREGVGKNLAIASIAAPKKPKVWMVIEPGIVGKIGFNSASVGVCLNAIRARPISTSLLPIHLLLRIALECESVDSAIASIESLGGAASSQHILIADKDGARGLELSPRGAFYLKEDENGILAHTNHFLENKLVDEPPWLSGSPIRLERAKAICGELIRELGPDRLGEIDAKLLRARVFSDTFNSPQAICCSPDPNRVARIQTLFNIVMTFEPGKSPTAEVVFGKPGSDNESSVYFGELEPEVGSLVQAKEV
ncbi:AAT-domain-containing protein [Trametes coccinea BRFM310]|uniref:AAT-domain-containing protein n=1 Tax=Trametes coccinea (strain BRFM310) TaxID=1353009 RepID=A0A1Y2I643_TRAC3|nr:AAT-domain-containing protein [Trametes coccinea BRFM310]